MKLVSDLKSKEIRSWNLFGRSFESSSKSYFNSSVVFFEFEGSQYVLKTRKRFSDITGLFSALFTHYESFRPFSTKLQYEKDKLVEMNAKRLPVPVVVDVDVPDTLVTRYIGGVPPKDTLKDLDVPFDRKLEIITGLAHALCLIHEEGYFQGSPSVKNARYSENQGYWLDFGTVPVRKFSTEYLQTMDLEGFVYSACRNCLTDDPQKDVIVVDTILSAYSFSPVLNKLGEVQPDKVPLYLVLISRKRQPSTIEKIRKAIVRNVSERPSAPYFPPPTL